MKKISIICLSLALIFGLLAVFFWVRIPEDNLRSFRTSHHFARESKIQDHPDRVRSINWQGLDRLYLSGSAIPDINALKNYQCQIEKDLFVVSLLPKEELYVGDATLSDYCLNYTDHTEITLIESVSLKRKVRCSLRRYFAGVPQNNPKAWMEMAKCEWEKLEASGINYRRLIYGTPHSPTEDHGAWVYDLRWVDDYIALVESLPKDAAIHFHCEHGRGRTTVCMVMYDIFKNAKQVSLQDIVDRQWAIGGEDMFDTAARRGGTWTPEMLQKRKELITQFYAYMVDEKQGYGHSSFAQWQKNHPYEAK